MSDSVVSINYNYLNYNDLLILSKCPYQLTLSIEELTKPAVKNRGESDKPPRPQNSWIIFRKDYEANLRLCYQHVKLKVKETAKECSLKWRKLPSEVKHFFKILEKIACANHQNLYPNYKYKPQNTKNANIKKWIFREQKKYAFVPLPISSSLTLRNEIMNHTASTIECNRNVITTSTTIDYTYPFINTNIDATATAAAVDDYNTNTYETPINESFVSNTHDNVSINNSSSPNQFITNNQIMSSYLYEFKFRQTNQSTTLNIPTKREKRHAINQRPVMSSPSSLSSS
ncbi:7187_t:CDS:2 [Ambispora gerdemannii]|uniref:7187_t:CDS:1 n=1 Tax=Ambispora gerdemannii TaxID=144530 RepID=A0A9N9B9C1_9GLOM|nr:7187_t:CDS:2 [Ambispora gerdemannii]